MIPSVIQRGVRRGGLSLPMKIGAGVGVIVLILFVFVAFSMGQAPVVEEVTAEVPVAF